MMVQEATQIEQVLLSEIVHGEIRRRRLGRMWRWQKRPLPF